VEKGYLTSDTSQPAGAAGRIYTREQIAKMSTTEYAKNKEDIDNALRENRVK